jgi:hypothetical protein
MNYNLGDVVKVISKKNSIPAVTYGCIGTIIEIDNKNEWVKLDIGRGYFFFEDNIELFLANAYANSKHGKVIVKIKYIEQKRKSLGYPTYEPLSV